MYSREKTYSLRETFKGKRSSFDIKKGDSHEEYRSSGPLLFASTDGQCVLFRVYSYSHTADVIETKAASSECDDVAVIFMLPFSFIVCTYFIYVYFIYVYFIYVYFIYVYFIYDNQSPLLIKLLPLALTTSQPFLGYAKRRQNIRLDNIQQ